MAAPRRPTLPSGVVLGRLWWIFGGIWILILDHFENPGGHCKTISKYVSSLNFHTLALSGWVPFSNRFLGGVRFYVFLAFRALPKRGPKGPPKEIQNRSKSIIFVSRGPGGDKGKPRAYFSEDFGIHFQQL